MITPVSLSPLGIPEHTAGRAGDAGGASLRNRPVAQSGRFKDVPGQANFKLGQVQRGRRGCGVQDVAVGETSLGSKELVAHLPVFILLERTQRGACCRPWHCRGTAAEGYG